MPGQLIKTIKVKTTLSFREILPAIASGVMLTLSFPPIDLSFIAWFALIPLFKCLEGRQPAQAFRLGLITGIVHYLSLVYWIVVVLGRYGNLNIFLSAGFCLLLCLYLALYPAIFSLFIPFLRQSRFFVLLAGSFWVGLEYIRAIFLTGFPWCLIGYTQHGHLNIIQVADLFGVYGLSFLIILVNAGAYSIMSRLFYKTDSPSVRNYLSLEIILVALMFIGTLAYGHFRLSKLQAERPDQLIKSVIVQGNIDQSLKWDPAYQAETVATYRRLTLSSNDFKPDLVVWPETAVPFFFQDDSVLSEGVASIAKEAWSLLIFGAPAYKQIGGNLNYYNRAYLISPDQNSLQCYDKVHLVPFGEYVPLKKLLSFINRLVPAAGDFAQGDEVVTLKNDTLSIGMLICFEGIFPELARAHAKNGGNILVNITNDAWFGKTSAPYQHLAMSVFRAVENRVPLIRAANTGFSAFISPQGKIISRGSLFTEEILKAVMPVLKRPLSFYTRFGDIFAILLLAVSVVKSILCLRRRNIIC